MSFPKKHLEVLYIIFLDIQNLLIDLEPLEFCWVLSTVVQRWKSVWSKVTST